MKFTIPHAADYAQAESVWSAVRKFLDTQGHGTESRRIARIAFRHNGKLYDLGVGDIHPDLHEAVLVILKGTNPSLYYICTANRGVVRGDPYLVGAGMNTHTVDYEA